MRETRKYTFVDWPAADQAAWEEAMSTKGSYFARGRCAHWAPETLRQAFYAYARWLAYLTERRPGALLAAPQDRLTPDRLEGFVDALAQGVTAQTAASTINHFVNALRAIAPEYKPVWLRQRQARYQRQIKPRDKRGRMVPVADLYALGYKLMDEAADMSDERAAARTFRDVLIIAVLVSSAVRRKNLAALVFSRDLHRVGSHYHIVIDAKATKSKKRIDHPLPNKFTPYLDQYLNNYRLRFPGATQHDALWLSAKGGALTQEAIWAAVSRRTRSKFGHGINLHLFRDIAATSAPKLGTALLGHSNAALTDQHYRRSDPLAASRQLAGVIADLRAAAATTPSIERVRAATVVPSPPSSTRILSEAAISP